MVQLAQDLQKKRDITESTADAYIRTLVMLNDKKPFKNVSFLRNTDSIMEKIQKYAITTKKNIIATACAVLSMYQQPAYKKAYNFYAEQLKNASSEYDAARGDTMEKTDKEKENWVNWKDVVQKRDELAQEIKGFATARKISMSQYDKLLNHVLLCLYTYLPPRRNMDYQEMWVVRKWNENMPTDRNYLDLDGDQFIFNRFKTARKSGQQRIPIPNTEEAPMKEALIAYLRHNPHFKASRSKSVEFRFLTKADGTPMTAVNAITRLLNKLFGKRVGSSMLRHSYLSEKYGTVLEEMKQDAELMAHSDGVQRTYIRKGDNEDTIEHA